MGLGLGLGLGVRVTCVRPETLCLAVALPMALLPASLSVCAVAAPAWACMPWCGACGAHP